MSSAKGDPPAPTPDLANDKYVNIRTLYRVILPVLAGLERDSSVSYDARSSTLHGHQASLGKRAPSTVHTM